MICLIESLLAATLTPMGVLFFRVVNIVGGMEWSRWCGFVCLIGSLFAPMLTKLEGYTTYESVYREMVLLGLKYISRGESPRNIQDQMLANLPPKLQEQLEAA